MSTSDQDQELKQVSYDETFYPRAADESETESATTDEDMLAPTTPSNIQSTSPTLPDDAIIPQEKEEQDVSKDDTLTPDKMEETTKTNEEGIIDTMMCGVCFQLLLDPITLNCGHSFCHVCLAHMWQTSRNPTLLCPMCRQPWAQQLGRLPSVNVIFRDILEHTFPDKIKERRDAMSENELEVIRHYNNVQQGNVWQQTRPVRRQINARIDVLCFLAAVFFCAVFIGIIIVSAGIWAMGGMGSNFIRKPVPHWSNSDVLQWLGGLGESVQKDTHDIFEREKIDGRHLIKLSDDSLKSYGVVSDVSRTSLLLSIDELREVQYAPPRNFDEFKASNKEDVVLLLLTYKIFPRLTFGYLYFFRYYEIFLPVVQAQLHRGEVIVPPTEEPAIEPQKELTKVESIKRAIEKEGQGETRVDDSNEKMDKFPEKPSEDLSKQEPTRNQLIAIFIEILLVPHLVVAAYVLTLLPSDLFLSIIILLHCVTATLREVKDLRNKLRMRAVQERTALKSLLTSIFLYIIFYLILMIVGQVVCYLLPSFALDTLFYLLLLHTIYSLSYDRIFRPIFSHLVGVGLRFLIQLNNR